MLESSGFRPKAHESTFGHFEPIRAAPYRARLQQVTWQTEEIKSKGGMRRKPTGQARPFPSDGTSGPAGHAARGTARSPGRPDPVMDLSVEITTYNRKEVLREGHKELIKKPLCSLCLCGENSPRKK